MESVKLPRRSPNLNAYAERFVLSIKSECLDRLILFGERSLRRAISEFILHYHGERPHQGLGGNLVSCGQSGASSSGGEIRVAERLGGLLKHYYRNAA